MGLFIANTYMCLLYGICIVLNSVPLSLDLTVNGPTPSRDRNQSCTSPVTEHYWRMPGEAKRKQPLCDFDNGSFRSNRVISFKYQVLHTQLKSLIYKGFCGTKPGRHDDFLVSDVSVKRFLRLFSGGV